MSKLFEKLRRNSDKNVKKKSTSTTNEGAYMEEDNSCAILPDPDTNMPSRVWKLMLENGGKHKEITAMNIHLPILEDKLRFVCLSDTHSKLKPKDEKSDYFIPPGDILLHAGDFTMKGGALEIETFNEYLGGYMYLERLSRARKFISNIYPIKTF